MPFTKREYTINRLIPHVVFTLFAAAALLKQPAELRAAFRSLR